MIKTKIPLISCYFKFKNHKCKDLNKKCLCEQIKNKEYIQLDRYIQRLLLDVEENENESDDENNTCFYCQ